MIVKNSKNVNGSKDFFYQLGEQVLQRNYILKNNEKVWNQALDALRYT